uniref:EMYY motif lipoprotein n=1 Tax=Rhabditophanes sp. KR3021 TaxID=114890 RepID=A0AC35UDJ1_9BILA
MSKLSVCSIFVVLMAFSLISCQNIFRMDKMNFIYDKAMSQGMDKGRLTKLKVDLTKFDTLLLDMKHEADSMKATGYKEIDAKLLLLLHKYDLEDVHDAFVKKYKNSYAIHKEAEPVKLGNTNVKFQYKKTIKLWKLIESSELEDQLKVALIEELKKYETDYSEYEKLLNKRHVVEDSNHITEDGGPVTHGLKLHLNEAYEVLASKISDLTLNPFTQPKVRKLYYDLIMNKHELTTGQRDEIKAELRELNGKLTKLDYQKQQIQDYTAFEEEHDLKTGIPKGTDESFEEMKRHVKKFEAFIDTKINRHEEL